MLTAAAVALLYHCISWLCLLPEYFSAQAATLVNIFLIYSLFFYTEL